MTSDDITRPSEHEQQVAREERERRGLPTGEILGGDSAEVGTTPYETEIEEERRGTTAEEVSDEVTRDESEPFDTAYRPRSG